MREIKNQNYNDKKLNMKLHLENFFSFLGQYKWALIQKRLVTPTMKILNFGEFESEIFFFIGKFKFIEVVGV